MFAHCSFAMAALLCAGCALAASEPAVAPVLQRPALLARQPAQAVLIDIARAGQRLVAAGEQGLILLSDDAGKHWRQTSVPVSVSLTALSFPTARQGWAVGHGGSILHTADGGESWTLQLDGRQAAERVLAAVKEDPAATERQRKVAEGMVADGADKPLLAVHFSNDREGTAVGAFGLVLHTDDGGQTWASWGARLDNPAGNHLYAVVAADEQIYIAGEQGVLFSSLDNGAHFKRLRTPYEGSYFAANLSANGDLLLLGLRGNAWRTHDQGEHWQQVGNPQSASLVASWRVDPVQVMLVDQAGHLLLSRAPDQQLQLQPAHAVAPVASLAQAPDGVWVVVGARGVRRLDGQGEAR